MRLVNLHPASTGGAVVGIGVVVGTAQYSVVKVMFCQWVRFWFPARSTVIALTVITVFSGRLVRVSDVVEFVWFCQVPFTRMPIVFRSGSLGFVHVISVDRTGHSYVLLVRPVMAAGGVVSPPEVVVIVKNDLYAPLDASTELIRKYVVFDADHTGGVSVISHSVRTPKGVFPLLFMAFLPVAVSVQLLK